MQPRHKRHVLYLGDIAEPPRWLPLATHPLINPILENALVGLFTIENPTEEEVRQLERTARESNGIAYVFKAGGTEFCVFIGSREVLCTRQFAGEDEQAIHCDDFADAVERFSSGRFTLSLRGGSFSLGDRTRIMGILNVTPDSFSDGGSFYRFDAAVAQAEKMAEEGADILDIGGESTRPGAEAIPEEEEARRVMPVIEYLVKRIETPISIDTCKAGIARRALDAGAQIVNDVSALRYDPEMVNVVAENGCPLILMHMLGAPKSMQENPQYEALVPEIIAFLKSRIDFASKEGVKPEQIIVDPGIGFGKTVEHNLEILRGLAQFKALGRPLLVGPSRKSTIGKILGAEVEDRVEGTAAAVTVSIINGAHLVRVHDVKQMARVARMTDAIMRVGSD
jgi:dihydropteroate synthase